MIAAGGTTSHLVLHPQLVHHEEGMPKLQLKEPHEWYIVGDVLASFTSAGVIDDETWAQYVDVLQNGKFRVNLACSADGSISSTQCKGASDAVKSRNLPVIVLTDSRITRGVVTALNWLGANTGAYSWASLNAALKSLEVDPKVEEELRAMVEQFIEARVKVCMEEENLLQQWLAELDLGSEIDGLVDTARNWVLFCSPMDVNAEQLCLFYLDDYRGEIGKMCKWYHRTLAGGTLLRPAPRQRAGR